MAAGEGKTGENNWQMATYHILAAAGVTTAFHPISYAKCLIQLGYEPIAPVASKNIFGREVWVYPNIFKYLGHIRQQDGFFGMYRGLGPRLLSTTIAGFVSTRVQQHLHSVHPSPPGEELDGVEADAMDSIKKLCMDSTHEMIARGAGIIAAQPFQVIMIRSMAQFIGGETYYNTVWSSMKEIYDQEGILGFFVGLAPRLLGEALTIWLANTMAHIVNNYLIPADAAPKDMKNYTGTICAMLVTQVTYPFGLIHNVLSVNGSRLAAGNPPLMPVYSGWKDCWHQLAAQGQIKRGSSLFFRYYMGPTKHLGTGAMGVHLS